MDVLAVDIGIAFLALALLAILKPKRLVPPLTRGRGALLAALGFALLLGGLALPIRPPRLPGPPMALDAITPRYQFGEHHEILVAAPPEPVYAAVRAVTAGRSGSSGSSPGSARRGCPAAARRAC